jgi:hypothetical protein
MLLLLQQQQQQQQQLTPLQIASLRSEVDAMEASMSESDK